MSSFGIDFGTTNTAVVECLITEHQISKTVYGENNQPFPSLVALHPENAPIFGWEVKKRRNQLNKAGYHIIGSFKSILGSSEMIKVGEKLYSPMDITSMFLSYIKNKVESLSTRKLDEAVIAIPVDFKPEQRKNLREAAMRAGIKVKSFVSEPTAAYVSCRDELKGSSNVAVFDWGGGTLDVSMISVEKREVSEIAIAGMRLGGNDIDLLLAKHVHARLMQETANGCNYEDLTASDKDQIVDKVEDCKKRLSQDDTAPIRLMRYAGKSMLRSSVTLDEFSKLIQSRVDSAVKLLFDAAEKGNITLGEMDAILMVGGSCEIQSIYQRMMEIAEEYHLRLLRPEGVQWSVATGAAILCASQPVYRLQNGFGVLLADDSFYPVFKADTVAPCKAQELRFGVVEDTNNAVFVFVDEHKNVMSRKSVPIKGFTAEGIHLQCEIDDNMIVHIRIFSDYMQKNIVEDQLNQLAFTYRI